MEHHGVGKRLSGVLFVLLLFNLSYVRVVSQTTTPTTKATNATSLDAAGNTTAETTMVPTSTIVTTAAGTTSTTANPITGLTTNATTMVPTSTIVTTAVGTNSTTAKPTTGLMTNATTMVPTSTIVTTAAGTNSTTAKPTTGLMTNATTMVPTSTNVTTAAGSTSTTAKPISGSMINATTTVATTTITAAGSGGNETTSTAMAAAGSGNGTTTTTANVTVGSGSNTTGTTTKATAGLGSNTTSTTAKSSSASNSTTTAKAATMTTRPVNLGSDGTSSTTASSIIDRNTKRQYLNNVTVVERTDFIEALKDKNSTAFQAQSVKVLNMLFETFAKYTTNATDRATVLKAELLSCREGSTVNDVLMKTEVTGNTNVSDEITNAIQFAETNRIQSMNIDASQTGVAVLLNNQLQFSSSATNGKVDPLDISKGSTGSVSNKDPFDDDYQNTIALRDKYILEVTLPCFIGLAFVIIIFCICTSMKNSPLFALCSTAQQPASKGPA